ncbi:MAG: hypothetical protein HY043_05705 [Verrucomicrobia bacterium]|nr:hypothetical protein [Verrucomicrobiota bacterium]
MKTSTLITLVATQLAALGVSLFAAPPQFNSGSNGSLGALVVTNDTTLDMPPDGIFHYTTITVAHRATLRFNKNPLNTPVYLLATGDVAISGGIDVSAGNASGGNGGLGGPGGFDGGQGAYQGHPDGDGQGPGGGKNGFGGGFGYGNSQLSPLIGGSGGSASGTGGGGGGGAILIASNTKVSLFGDGGSGGTVTALGGSGHQSPPYSGGGSGGAIRIVAPVVEGSGALDVKTAGYPRGGGTGRTRMDATDRFKYRDITMTGTFSRGSQMFVFPLNQLRLDIVEAAGTTIPVGTNAPVVVSLLPGSSTNQVIKVQATNFTNDVPITVSIVPENGASSQFNGLITLNSGSPSVGTVNVVIPVDTICHVNVWTR